MFTIRYTFIPACAKIGRVFRSKTKGGTGEIRMEKELVFLPYKMLQKGGSGEITEKKSRFIATLAPVESEEEAAAFIESVKKKYWDARHNCSAFVLGERAQITRCSDDGEPAGTAGKPMLEVLLGTGVRNAAAVVTRYFGGVLLGTGGLVRAYTQAMHAGLDACPVVTMCYGTELRLVTDYNGIGKLQYLLGQRSIPIEEAVYTQEVTLVCWVAHEEKDGLLKEITETTAGAARVRVSDPFYYKYKSESTRKKEESG